MSDREVLQRCSSVAVRFSVHDAVTLVRDAEQYARHAKAASKCTREELDELDARHAGGLLGFMLRTAHDLVDAGAKAEDVRALLEAGLRAGGLHKTHGGRSSKTIRGPRKAAGWRGQWQREREVVGLVARKPRGRSHAG